jgi:hypothetical protein
MLCLASVLANGLGCSEPTLPSNAVETAALPQYAMWWQMTESCSGVTKPFSDIRWSYIPGGDAIVADGETAYGFYFGNSSHILVGEKNLSNGPLIRHEMLHALVGGTDHPPPYFRDKCGGIVECGPSCQESPLPLPPADAPILGVADLVLSVNVTPKVFTDSSSGGWLGITVSATNQRSSAVWVDLPHGRDATAVGWGFYTTLPITSGFASLPFHQGFAAGETKRYTFDVNIAHDAGLLSAGSYQVSGWLNLVQTAPATIVVP